jgi:hypothetical protein
MDAALVAAILAASLAGATRSSWSAVATYFAQSTMPPDVNVEGAIQARWTLLARWNKSVSSTRLDAIIGAADGPSRDDLNRAILLRTNQPAGAGGRASASRGVGGRRGRIGAAGRGGRGGHAATAVP